MGKTAVPQIIVSEGRRKPKVYSIPQIARVPYLFIDFPLIGRNILNAKNPTRKMLINSSAVGIVKNFLTPVAFKIFLILLAHKQEKTSLIFQDIMEYVGIEKHKGLSNFFVKHLKKIVNSLCEYYFLSPEESRKYILSSNLEKSNGKYVYATRLISAYELSFSGKKRSAVIHLAPFLEKIKTLPYIKVRLSDLRILSNRYPEGLLTYLLIKRHQKLNDGSFLLGYYLSCSERKLQAVSDKATAKKIQVLANRSYYYIREVLQKLVEAGIIKKYGFSTKRIQIGKFYTFEWFEKLEFQLPEEE
jgi:hypothetical protein